MRIRDVAGLGTMKSTGKVADVTPQALAIALTGTAAGDRHSALVQVDALGDGIAFGFRPS